MEELSPDRGGVGEGVLLSGPLCAGEGGSAVVRVQLTGQVRERERVCVFVCEREGERAPQTLSGVAVEVMG